MELEKRAKGTWDHGSTREDAMMFAFALALIGIVVLKSYEHVAANA